MLANHVCVCVFIRSYEAKVHFGSRSLIIELVNEPRASMTKYLFKNFAGEPILCKLTLV